MVNKCLNSFLVAFGPQTEDWSSDMSETFNIYLP